MLRRGRAKASWSWLCILASSLMNETLQHHLLFPLLFLLFPLLFLLLHTLERRSRGHVAVSLNVTSPPLEELSVPLTRHILLFLGSLDNGKLPLRGMRECDCSGKACVSVSACKQECVCEHERLHSHSHSHSHRRRRRRRCRHRHRHFQI